MVHDANADLVRELHVPSNADDSAIQEALMKLFNAQVGDETESVVVEGQASRAKRSDENQALKASDSVRDQFSSVQFSSVQFRSVRVRVQALKTRSVQFKCTSIKQQ